MRIKSLVLSAVALGAGAAGANFAAEYLAVFVEDRSEIAVRETLDAGGYDWTEVEANGLQVLLTGTAPDEATRFDAMSAVGTVIDAARILDQTDVATTTIDLTPDFSIELLRSDQGVTMMGLIPAETDRTAILRDLSNAFGEENVADFLETADYAPPKDWAAAVAFGIDAITSLERAKVSIQDTAVSISAAATSPSEKSSLESRFARSAPDGVTVSLDITAPRPFLSPFTLRLVSDADGTARFDACVADTPESQDRIIAAARTIGVTGQITCPLALGAPNTDWGDTSVAAITALAGLPAGAVTLSDTTLSLDGALGTSPEDFDAAKSQLQSQISALYEVKSFLPLPPKEGDAEAALTFTATRSPEGNVRIRGNLGSELAETAARSFADAAFGAENHSLSVDLVPSTPENWSKRIFAGLEGLSLLQFGALEVEEESFVLRGSSGDPEIKEKITGLISAAMEDVGPFSLEVTYDEVLDPLASLLPGEVCVANIADILSTQKISFEPGSTTIDAGGNDTLDAIAGVIQSCKPDVVMEIGGHTDSQGSEQLNQRISQERAFAVRVALIDRRVSPSVLNVVGYGESTPIADNATEEGREANRRIEFILPAPPEDDTDTASDEDEPPASDPPEAPQEGDTNQ